MLIRHGKLHDVIGRPAKLSGFTIVPAMVELDGPPSRSEFSLCDLPSGRIAPVLRVPVEREYDVAWVRARLPHAFAISPEPTEMEKALLAISFVAVRDGTEEGIPFEASDYYGKTSIRFSDLEADAGLKQEIADAFWNILLSAPDDLSDFECRVFHPGGGVWIHYGCDGGEPYCRESSRD